MRIELRARQSGKTNDMLLRAHEADRIIVCIHQQEVARLVNLANELELEILRPITFDQFLKGDYDTGRARGIYIDNADMLLQTIAKARIDLITMTKQPSLSIPPVVG